MSPKQLIEKPVGNQDIKKQLLEGEKLELSKTLTEELKKTTGWPEDCGSLCMWTVL